MKDCLEFQIEEALARIAVLEEEKLDAQKRLKVLENEVKYLMDKDPVYRYKQEVETCMKSKNVK